MDKVLPSLDESEPVHGDLDTVLYLTDVHKVWEPYTLCSDCVFIIFFFYFTSKELSFSFYFCNVSKKCLLLHQAVFLALKLIVDKVLSCSYHNRGISVLRLYHFE